MTIRTYETINIVLYGKRVAFDNFDITLYNKSN